MNIVEGHIEAEAAVALEEKRCIPFLPKAPDSFHWYALYTRPRAEKLVHSRLEESHIEVFLPLYKTIRKWSDRKKLIEKPLFSSYVFVKVNSKQYYSVLKVEGVVKYVCFERKAVPIPERQIDNLKLLINSNARIEVTTEKFEKGDAVEVVHGVLTGLTGELIRINKKNKVVVRIDRIDQNLIVDIPAAYIKKI
jgi:transcription antitermination factor NusG